MRIFLVALLSLAACQEPTLPKGQLLSELGLDHLYVLTQATWNEDLSLPSSSDIPEPYLTVTPDEAGICRETSGGCFRDGLILIKESVSIWREPTDRLIIHEITHYLAWHLLGDPDSEHANTHLWSNSGVAYKAYREMYPE